MNLSPKTDLILSKASKSTVRVMDKNPNLMKINNIDISLRSRIPENSKTDPRKYYFHNKATLTNSHDKSTKVAGQKEIERSYLMNRSKSPGGRISQIRARVSITPEKVSKKKKSQDKHLFQKINISPNKVKFPPLDSSPLKNSYDKIKVEENNISIKVLDVDSIILNEVLEPNQILNRKRKLLRSISPKKNFQLSEPLGNNCAQIQENKSPSSTERSRIAEGNASLSRKQKLSTVSINLPKVEFKKQIIDGEWV